MCTHNLESLSFEVRYCPSLEAKIIRFVRDTHQIWIEPEGLEGEEGIIYPQGLSTALPGELQQTLVNKIHLASKNPTRQMSLNGN